MRGQRDAKTAERGEVGATMATMVDLCDELAAVEARYADLVEELAGLYQIREQLRRAVAEPGVARRSAPPSGKGPRVIPAPSEPHALSDDPLGGLQYPAQDGAIRATPALQRLRVVAGDEDAGVSPAQRLAQKQGTRALLRVVRGGKVAS